MKPTKHPKRLKLTIIERLKHFSIPLLLSGLTAFVIHTEYFSSEQLTTNQFVPPGEPAKFSFFWLVLSLALFIVQFWKLRYKTIAISLPPKEFKIRVQEIGDELGWSFGTLNQNEAVAYSQDNFIGWFERITIIRKKNELLINSIENPVYNEQSIFLLSFRNRRNIQSFKKKIIATTNSLPNPSDRGWTEFQA